ncbi:MAG: Asp-tRNA(Asn)/Glu-tRNA(Gln) amidotransferase subunit GatB [bacterium]|nr:Asp-tRNA(Asn)/Glu-tRNA(Gln) amidotransferase subunit GatB [bacterium]
MKLIPIIGLEVHAQLKTQTKMFCGCINVDDSAPPNTAICPICTGQPGTLPALNEHAIKIGIKTGLALNCRIPKQSSFDRKNYFYPDLPKGYQVSQFFFPIAKDGYLEVNVPGVEGPRARIRVSIERAHLEEDAAKNSHREGAVAVDFNRAGTPLLEIVTEPDLRSPQEAKAYLQELRAILRSIDASSADMEKGQMRCDANISLLEVDDENHPLQEGLNSKIEVKNLNSFRAVERALEHEIIRQTDLYQTNTKPKASTRGWDEDKGITFDQRSKETSADYRYFPEPDLPPQDLEMLSEIMATQKTELPEEKRNRLMEEYWFSKDVVDFLVSHDGWSDYAEQIMGELATWIEATDTSGKSGSELINEEKKRYAKLAGGWLTSKLVGILSEKTIDLKDARVTPENFAEFLRLLDDAKVNSANGQKLLTLMVETSADPSHLMEEHDLGQNMDESQLRAEIQRIIQQNPDKVAEFKAGKEIILKWFVGAVMKATEGKANPADAQKILSEELR